jgi:hypothetical protein
MSHTGKVAWHSPTHTHVPGWPGQTSVSERVGDTNTSRKASAGRDVRTQRHSSTTTRNLTHPCSIHETLLKAATTAICTVYLSPAPDLRA